MNKFLNQEQVKEILKDRKLSLRQRIKVQVDNDPNYIKDLRVARIKGWTR